MSSLSRSDRVDRFLSLCAGLAAITAVAVSLYQTSLAREQLRASAWPYLSQGNSFNGSSPYRFVLSNEGIGPARVRSFHVYADGRPMRTWNETVRVFTGEGEPALLYSAFHRGTVVPAGVTKDLLTLPNGPRAIAFFVAAQARLRTVVCYCSVYDECWRGDSEVDEPAPVKACAEDSTTVFRQ